MKRKAITLFLTMTVVISAAGCGRANNNKNNTGIVDNTENRGEGNIGSETMMQSSEWGTEADFNQLQLGNALELPEGFEGAEGETDAHGDLEKLIAGHLNIEEKNYKDFRYYYNYVDLNGDSKNEILAMVLGENFNDQGGNHLLWIDASGSTLSEDSILQEFQGVSAPVYISNHMTEGYRDLILCSNIGINNDAATGAAGTDNGGNANAAGTDNGGNANTAGTDNGGNVNTTGTENTAGTTDNNTAGGTGTTDNGAAGTNHTAGTGNGTANTAGTENNSGYVLLVWNGDRYQEINEGTVLNDLQGYEGNAVITNDLERDYREDTYHFLGEAMNL